MVQVWVSCNLIRERHDYLSCQVGFNQCRLGWDLNQVELKLKAEEKFSFHNSTIHFKGRVLDRKKKRKKGSNEGFS